MGKRIRRRAVSVVKNLPADGAALVIRTDFSDDAAWGSIRAKIEAPVDTFLADVQFIEDEEYRDISKAGLLTLLAGSNRTFVMVVDRVATLPPDNAVLVINLFADPGREFRAIPSQIQSVENNLSLANMDFVEFDESVGEDGVFRGFEGCGV